MIDTLQLACFRLLQAFQWMGQVEPIKVDPGREMTKARIVLGLVGMTILFVGMFLVFWLFSRYMRRMVSGDSDTPDDSRFSHFGYQYFEQLDREQKRKNLDE